MIALAKIHLFDLGQVIATPAALKAIRESGEEPARFLERHAQGDWGALFDEERRRNEAAIKSGGRIVSVYRTGNGVQLWVVTDAAKGTGRRTTTISLPSELEVR